MTDQYAEVLAIVHQAAVMPAPSRVLKRPPVTQARRLAPRWLSQEASVRERQATAAPQSGARSEV